MCASPAKPPSPLSWLEDCSVLPPCWLADPALSGAGVAAEASQGPAVVPLELSAARKQSLSYLAQIGEVDDQEVDNKSD